MNNINVKVAKAPEAKIPCYAHPGDAGMDLFSTEEVTLKPLERALVGTGIRIQLPEGYEAQIRPKSGLAIKHGISIVNTPGTVDSGYRGEVKVIMINLSDKSFEITKGMKIAQMVINKVETANMTEVDDLDDTSRSDGGFGSTGTH